MGRATFLINLGLCFKSAIMTLVFLNLLILERGGKAGGKEVGKERERRGKETEILTCHPTFLCIHWLFLVCTLTGDRTHNLGVSVHCSNLVRYPAAKATLAFLKSYF